MKTLNDYITEWKASTDNVSLIKKQCFIYKLTTNAKIQIFDKDWTQFKEYKDKVYINDEKVNLDSRGYTDKTYDQGTYFIKIDDIDNVTNCRYMFFDCTDLVEVPLFDTSKVENMGAMFYHCLNLREVALLNTRKDTNMNKMFYECNHLSKETKQIWSQVYNFDTDKRNENIK